MALLPKPVEASSPAMQDLQARGEAPQSPGSGPRVQRDLQGHRVLVLEQGLSEVKAGLEALGPSMDQVKGSMAALRASAGGSKAARRRACIALRQLQARSQELATALEGLGAEL